MLVNTARIPWVSLRGAVTTDDTPLSAWAYTDWPSSNTVKLSDAPLHDANVLYVGFHGTDAANEALTYYKLYGRSRTNGAIMLLLTGVATLGTMTCTTDPVDNTTAIANGLWADTITVTGGLFEDLVEVLDSGNDRLCLLKFDKGNIDELYMEIDMNTMASVYAVISGN
jgi:hypothetical protein